MLSFNVLALILILLLILLSEVCVLCKGVKLKKHHTSSPGANGRLYTLLPTAFEK